MDALVLKVYTGFEIWEKENDASGVCNMFERFIHQMKQWAQDDNCIESVIVVGSYARGCHNADSDLDLCLITPDKDELMKNQDFILAFGDFHKKQTEFYGACTSIRVWYKNGLEVEFGLVYPSWIDTPLDAGTRTVLCDGYRVIVDKKGYFTDLKLS